MARIPRLSSIVVGNIGVVYAGDNTIHARGVFKSYVRQSKDNYGRAAGEDVTWFMDGSIREEFIGSLSIAENEGI